MGGDEEFSNDTKKMIEKKTLRCHVRIRTEWKIIDWISFGTMDDMASDIIIGLKWGKQKTQKKNTSIQKIQKQQQKHNTGKPDETTQ